MSSTEFLDSRIAAQNPPQPGSAQDAPATQPGEFIHYYMNLLALFRSQRTVPEIESLARDAVANRDALIAEFSVNLQALRERFEAESACSGQRATVLPPPCLGGLDRAQLEAIRDQHGGLLIALFHYGRHRQVLADLACLGLPFVAPVAKRAYFECSDLARIAPPDFEQAMRLVEVEDPRVGRVLLQSLRAGRIGLIYVDGNMGPDGHLVADGAVEVDFLGCRIRVKAGIARLAQSLQLPILPLLVRQDSMGASSVTLGSLLAPASKSEATSPELRDADQQQMMQSLYVDLAAAVESGAQYWEFAFCLHRWLAQAPDETACASPQCATPPLDAEPARRRPEVALSLPRADVALFERDQDQFWVHVGRQKAYRLPAWARGLHAFIDGRAVRSAAAVDWLREQGASDDDAWSLLQGLRERNLLRPAADTAAIS